METYAATGLVVEIYDKVNITDTFSKREFIIEQEYFTQKNMKYNYIKFQCIFDRIPLLDNIKKGDTVSISFRIAGRKIEKDGKVNYYDNHVVEDISVISTTTHGVTESGTLPITPDDILEGDRPDEPMDELDRDLYSKDDDLPF